MRTWVQRITQQVIEEQGWRPGTPLENNVARYLGLCGWSPREVEQQYPVDNYRLDFAWPKASVALEADGWHRRSPEGAAKDAERDARLREQGWLVFRVDDRSEPGPQVARASEVIRLMWIHLAHQPPVRKAKRAQRG